MLKNLIDQHQNNTCSYVMEIISRFKDDKDDLEALLNRPLTKITDIKLGSGDSHNGGKTVALIYFGNDLAVYKPHALNGNNVLEGIIKWLSEKDRLQTPLRMQKYLPKNNYGWEKFVEYRECPSKEAVQRFYYRIGCYLAVFSSLGSTDLHYENIIADGEYPIFVDLETLIGSKKNSGLQTILETGLLPQISENQLIDVDISGITGRSGKSAKIKNIIICNDGTDQMYVKEEAAKVKNQRNIAKAKDMPVDIELYMTMILKGFDDASVIIINNKETYLKRLMELVEDGSEYRTILRHTHVYAKYLAAITHPDYLVSENKQKELLEHLEKNCAADKDIPRITFEKASLKRGDVPLFSCNVDSLNLYSNGEIVANEYYSVTPREALKERINQYNEKYLKNRSLIFKSLITASNPNKEYQDGKASLKKQVETTLSNSSNIEETLKKSLFEYIETINTNTYFSNDKSNALFHFNALSGGKIKLDVVSLDLYECGGMILLIAAAGIIYGKKEFLTLAKSLTTTGYQITEYRDKRDNLSAFAGEGSALYLFAALFTITKDTDYIARMNEVAKKIEDRIKANKQDHLLCYDFLNGFSGFITAISNIMLKKQLNSDCITNIFVMAKDMYLGYLQNLRDSKPIIGLAHGFAGYAYGAMAVYRCCREKKYLDFANDLLVVEEESICLNKWHLPSSWCKGESGLILPRLLFNEIDTEYRLLNKHISSFLKQLFVTKNYCLCHGLFGSVYTVDKLRESNKLQGNKQTNLQDIDSAIETIINSFLKNSNTINLGYNSMFTSDCFMTGKSGIYYSLLRRVYKELPDVISLEV